ncbi:undecaprenyl phosphate translocase family protein [Planctomycetota bacterium]
MIKKVEKEFTSSANWRSNGRRDDSNGTTMNELPNGTAGKRDDVRTDQLVLRASFGGVLMGLANLVPGISGGTMLLAAGIYPRFIEAVADVTRFRFRARSLLVLGSVVVAAGLAILMLAGFLKDLVVEQRWIMYSLFIGLTIGGLPIVWRMARPASKGVVVAAFVSFMLMVVLALMQAMGVVGSGGANFVMLFIAGMAGASAMILPGLSGGYLLLLLGQYVPILSAIDEFKVALKAKDFGAAMSPALSVIVPVGLGVVVGVALVGNILQWLLQRFQKVTLGALIGLLLGSTVGLWPFQHGVMPKPGDSIKGVVQTADTISDVDPEDWPTEYFRPSGGQVGCSLLLIGVGFGVTMGIARIGEE